MGTIPKWALVADSTLPRGTSREAVVTVSPVRAAGAAPPADRAVSTGPGQGRGARPWRILPWLVPILLSGACSPWSPSEVGDPPVYSNAFQPIMAGPPSSSVKVGAYYFGMFGPQWTDSVWGHSLWSQNIYGEDGTDDWWLGVRDLHERRPIKLEPTPPWMQEIWEADWGHLKPAIGYYDQSDVSTVERHIQQARENGLSYFSFYWYWSYAKPGEIWNDGLDSFLLASNADDMEFMINVCEHGWFLSIPAVQIEQVVQTLVGRYLVRPNYLTTAGGRPIIGICDGIGIWNMPTKPAPGSDNPPATQDVATLGLFLAHLREETAAATGVDPLVVFRPDGTKLWTKEASPLADGWNCLAPILHNEPKQTGAPHVHDYPENGKLLPGYLSYVADHPDPGKPLMPCLAQNFDERPRMGILISAPEEIDVMSGYSAEEFRVQLTTLRGWIDARDDEFSHLLTLYAWNEWHEGGILEPSARDGAALLGIVNEVFGLPQGSHPCRTTGLCPGESTTLLDHVDDSPIGNLDGVWPEGLAVGWAIDPDAPGSAVSMHFYLDGPYGTGAWLGMASANLPRPDVNAATGLSGDHGFSFVLPATAKDGNPHTLYAYAINIGSSAEHSVATQEFVLDAAGDPPPDDPGEPEPDSGDNPPIGNLEGVWPEGLAVGWALDPDSLLTSIDMHFYLDGPYGAGVSLGMASANLPRPDVNAVTGLPGDHGFAFVLPAIAKDGDPHTLYAYAINVGSSAEHALFTLSFSLEAEDGGGGDPEPAPENPDGIDDSPIGNLEGVWPEGLAVGWAIDPDSLLTSIDMHFYLDGPYGAGVSLGMASANLPRPDVNAVTGLPGDHGFSFVLPAIVKDGYPHTLYAYAINVGTSAEHALFTLPFSLEPEDGGGDPEPEPENPDGIDDSPIGNLEGVWPEGLAVGWAIDPDSLLTSIDMHFYLDGPYGAGVSLGMASANLPRPDVNAVTGLPGDHGFSFVLPAIAKDGYPHTLYAYAINVGTSAEHALFTLPFSLMPENPGGVDDSPIGNLEGVWPQGLAVGWALDPDSPLTSIDMHFYLDGPYGTGVWLGMASANLPRPDVNAVTGLPGDHGFSFVLPAIAKDGNPHTLYAYAINVGSSAEHALFTQSFVVGP